MARKRGPWVDYQFKHDPCVYCGDRYYHMTIDHIDPRCKGAPRTCTVDNSAASCRWCNEEKDNMRLLPFLMHKKVGAKVQRRTYPPDCY